MALFKIHFIYIYYIYIFKIFFWSVFFKNNGGFYIIYEFILLFDMKIEFMLM